MRAFVTGGTGFVGSNLVKKLIEDGHEVTMTHVGGENPTPKDARVLQPTFTGINWSKVGKQDVVFHQAANNDTRCSDREEMFKANVLDTQELFMRLHKLGCSKFIYASSTAVYGNSPAPYFEDSTPLKPLNVYAESKIQMEEAASTFGQRTGATVIGLRYCNVYGPGEGHKGKRMSMIGQMFRTLRGSGKIRLYTPGDQRRDWVYVKDVVQANLLAMNSEVSGVYNVGSGASITFTDLAHLIIHHLRQNLVPADPSRWIKYIDHPFPEEYQNHTECNVEKARKMLSYVPSHDFQSGVANYWANFNGPDAWHSW